MSEETPAKSGDAAWKEQRDNIARRNADAHQRSQGARRERATQAAASAREDAMREAELLRDLNKRIARVQSRRTGS
jgi:hypothetical protein